MFCDEKYALLGFHVVSGALGKNKKTEIQKNYLFIFVYFPTIAILFEIIRLN